MLTKIRLQKGQEIQEIKLAPLTLLVGNHHSGRTAFLGTVENLLRMEGREPSAEAFFDGSIQPKTQDGQTLRKIRRERTRRTQRPQRPQRPQRTRRIQPTGWTRGNRKLDLRDFQGPREGCPTSILHYMEEECPGHMQTMCKDMGNFGIEAGLFNRVFLHYTNSSRKKGGKRGSVEIRIKQATHPGKDIHWMDAGNGVFQTIQNLTHLLWSWDDCDVHLLRNPEAGLHPRGAAAWGSLLARRASEDHQILVETQSDHLESRIRSDIREGKASLEAEAVRFAYFADGGRIHNMEIDCMGNLEDAPQEYRQFDMAEVNRRIKLGHVPKPKNLENR